MTLSAAVDDSEVVHNVIGNQQLTFPASGRAWREYKKGFGLHKTVASGVGARKVIRCLNMTVCCWSGYEMACFLCPLVCRGLVEAGE